MAANFGRPEKVASTATHTLVVYRNTEWEEWIAVVRFALLDARNHKPVIVSTYHSDDKEDAVCTGRTELARATNHNVREPLDPEQY